MDNKFKLIFKNAENPYTCGGYDQMFEKTCCKKCGNFEVVEGYKSCNANGYPIPILQHCGKRKCASFK